MNESEETDPNPVSGDDGGTLGDPRVDAAVSSLREVDGRSVAEHPDVYERAHEALRQALDDGGPSAGTPSDPR